MGRIIREHGFDVFDDWFAAGPEADDYWRDYEKSRGRNMKEALMGRAARHVFDFDVHHIETSDMVVLLLPAGKSGHLEFCYARGRGKPGFILFPEEPERYDVMYQFATDLFFDEQELLDELDNWSNFKWEEGIAPDFLEHDRSYG